MVASLDGFIAKMDNSVSWLESTDHYEPGITLSDGEIATFLQGIDCYVMGSRTYEHALKLGWPYGEVPVIVLSSRALSSERKNVRFFSGDLKVLVEDQLKPQYHNIWMAGGAKLTKSFILHDLADRIIVSIMPVILGDGIPFFDFIGQERRLHLSDVKAYEDGMVELSYQFLRTGKS